MPGFGRKPEGAGPGLTALVSRAVPQVSIAHPQRFGGLSFSAGRELRAIDREPDFEWDLVNAREPFEFSGA